MALSRAPDALVRVLSEDGELSVRAVVATALVGEAARRHSASPTATAALGRTLMGALLLASGSKESETTQVQLRGDGPLRGVTAIADEQGRVRGYAHDPGVSVPLRGGKLDVGGAVGQGVLCVVRSRPSWKEPYSGIVPLVSGEVAEDLSHYLWESEQVPSAVALGVYVGPDRGVVAAGGYLVQALPSARSESLERLGETVRSLPPVSAMLRAGTDAAGLLERLLGGLGQRTVHSIRPEFSCPCDPQRVQRAIFLLGPSEAESALRERGAIEVTCEFCAERYVLGRDEVEALFA